MMTVFLLCEIFFFLYRLKMTSPHGNCYDRYSNNVVKGQFAFQEVDGGDYMIYFFSADHKLPTNLTIVFDCKAGVASGDWTNIAKKGSVEGRRNAGTLTDLPIPKWLGLSFLSILLYAAMAFEKKKLI